jgi:uncharacterized phage protein (TIGR01671 family)
MRPIKFRCFNKRTKELKKVSRIFFNENTVEVYTDPNIFDNPTWHLDYCELMQFTGLHDSSGQEIYESDILKIGEFLFVVIYELDSFKLKQFGIDEQNRFDLSEVNKYSVVFSTIQENPELLESK